MSIQSVMIRMNFENEGFAKSMDFVGFSGTILKPESQLDLIKIWVEECTLNYLKSTDIQSESNYDLLECFKGGLIFLGIIFTYNPEQLIDLGNKFDIFLE